MLARKCRVRPVSKKAATTSRFSTSPHEHRKLEPLSNAEWEVRTGRAINVLTETLPQFFSTGLVLSIDKSKLPDIVDASRYQVPNGTGVRNVVEGVGSFVTGMARNESTVDSEADGLETRGDVEPIYSSKVQLVYTPKGFERTLHIQGAPLYATSSVFVRHTLNALYSDLRVDLLSTRTAPPQPSSLLPSSNQPGKGRDRSLSMRIGVSGLARVSGTKSEWEVDCTYSFSPTSGLILVHTVNSIHPAPHESVYEAFRLGFGRLGLGFSPEPGTGAQGTICKWSTLRKVE